MLANRLKNVVGKVAFKAQNVFVEGRQILDAMFIVNKAIDVILRSNDCGMLCTLDIEQAYDHVNWSFLLSVTKKMSFRERWIG